MFDFNRSCNDRQKRVKRGRMIEHANIFYCKDISEIGGVETWVYELVKKFKDYDIAVVYKTGNIKQLQRIYS